MIGTPAVLLFLLVLAVLYVAARGIVVRWAARKIRRRPPPKTARWRRGVGTAVLALAGAGLACVLYAWRVEPYWPEVTRVRIETDKLPAGTPSVRIVQLSDLYCESTVRLERRLPGIVADLDPDLIIFTGDAINAPSGMEPFARVVVDLKEIAPPAQD